VSGASIAIPFAIGEELWWVGYAHREAWETCPECDGQRVVTIIRGNGETFPIECQCCALGFERASGLVKRTYFEHSPKVFIPGRVDISGGEIRYSESSPDANCYGSADCKDLFRDRAECVARCAELNAEQKAAEEKMFLWNMLDRRKKMAWSVHYWSREVKEYERKLEAARVRLGLCKEREAKKAAKEGAK
jgi:hypothetical protein